MALKFKGFEGLPQPKDAPNERLIERLRFDDAMEIPPQLADRDVWANYMNQDLYDMDNAVRDWLRTSASKRKRTKQPIKTAAPLVFLAIFGRAPIPSDGYAFGMLHRVLSYYATGQTGSTKLQGVRFNKTYKFGPGVMQPGRERRPLSIKLRMEEHNNGKYDFREYTRPGDPAK